MQKNKAGRHGGNANKLEPSNINKLNAFHQNQATERVELSFL